MSDAESNYADAMKRLEWTVRSLAADADVQIALFPSFVCVADELVLDFDEYHTLVLDTPDEFPLSASQTSALRSLDDAILAMSGEEHLHFWTDEALRDAPEWADLRERAFRVILDFGWPVDPPPLDRAIYVGPPGT